MVYSEAKETFMSGNISLNSILKNQIHLNPGANIIEAKNAQGKLCQLIDNTGTINQRDLTELLSDLIENEHFGINALSSTDGTINIDKPRLTHIQFSENLYRLLVYRYQAVIENF